MQAQLHGLIVSAVRMESTQSYMADVSKNLALLQSIHTHIVRDFPMYFHV